MRAQSGFTGRYRLQKRSFLTETHFLKFAEPRDEDNLINRVLNTPNFSANEIPIATSQTHETAQRPAILKRALSAKAGD
jgi:hypothetical protein